MKKIRRSRNQRKHLAKSYKKHLAKSYKKHLRKTYKKHLRKTYKGGVKRKLDDYHNADLENRQDQDLESNQAMRYRSEDLDPQAVQISERLARAANPGRVFSGLPPTDAQVREAVAIAGTGTEAFLFWRVHPNGPVGLNQAQNHGELKGWTMLHNAAVRNNTSVVKRLLREGAIPNLLNEEQQTPADLARLRGDPALADYIDDWVNTHHYPPPRRLRF